MVSAAYILHPTLGNSPGDLGTILQRAFLAADFMLMDEFRVDGSFRVDGRFRADYRFPVVEKPFLWFEFYITRMRSPDVAYYGRIISYHSVPGGEMKLSGCLD